MTTHEILQIGAGIHVRDRHEVGLAFTGWCLGVITADGVAKSGFLQQFVPCDLDFAERRHVSH